VVSSSWRVPATAPGGGDVNATDNLQANGPVVAKLTVGPVKLGKQLSGVLLELQAPCQPRPPGPASQAEDVEAGPAASQLSVPKYRSSSFLRTCHAASGSNGLSRRGSGRGATIWALGPSAGPGEDRGPS